MLPLYRAVNATVPAASTTNGMAAYASTGAHLVDLFFYMGGLRHKPDEFVPLLAKAWTENPELALKALFYHRDVRGGQGERVTFRKGLRWLATVAPAATAHVVPLVPVYGRWDDLLVLLDTPVRDRALDVIKGALLNRDALCAKWMPREGKALGALANELRQHLGLTWKEYRQLLARNTKVIETLMCRKAWSEINYNHVPSQAAHRYRKAFKRNDELRYQAWLSDVTAGVEGAKINASTLFPHQLLQNVLSNPQADAQWKALPNYCTKPGSVLPVLDVSGSMGSVMTPNSPMQVCVGLGLYLAERLQGPFQDHFVTFSDKPTLHHVPATLPLASRMTQVMGAPWGMSTNLEAVFSLLLERARAARLPASDLPSVVLIISDMQFNQCVREPDQSALGMLQSQYAASGYTMPQVVFWNVNAHVGTAPATFTASRVALVSGYSPSIVKQLLESPDDLTPYVLALRTLLSERYAAVTLPA